VNSMKRSAHGWSSAPLLAAILLCSSVLLGQATKISPPKNNYELADDVKLGQEAAGEVRKQLPLLPEGSQVDAYVERVGATLSAAIPDEFRHPEFRYDFSVVNASDINAFALPGGPMFVNRGMIEAANTEGEMAGVMAHEISHVALRHGTAQATKSQNPGIQLGALGGAILGAIIGGKAGGAIAQGTQLGFGAYLLKFSREYETQADILGAQIMARAGYDPMDLARMFETIQKQGGRGGPEFLSSHPNPDNRSARIAEESKKLTVSRRNNNSEEFNTVRSTLSRMPAAPTLGEIEKSQAGKNDPAGRPYPDDARIKPNVERPSPQYREFEVQNVLRVSIPSNWRDFGDQSSVTFAPEGAYGTSQGQSVFTHGAIVGITGANSNRLQQATEEFLSGLLQANSYLKAERSSQRTTIDGREALVRKLRGVSNVTGRSEVVSLYTTLLRDGRLLYMVHVAPENELRQYTKAFNDMTKSLRVMT
jgi:beta-barrel assembly-enhancing protease